MLDTVKWREGGWSVFLFRLEGNSLSASSPEDILESRLRCESYNRTEQPPSITHCLRSDKQACIPTHCACHFGLGAPVWIKRKKKREREGKRKKKTLLCFPMVTLPALSFHESLYDDPHLLSVAMATWVESLAREKKKKKRKTFAPFLFCKVSVYIFLLFLFTLLHFPAVVDVEITRLAWSAAPGQRGAGAAGAALTIVPGNSTSLNPGTV